MSILSKSGVGRIRHIESWLKENDDPNITYQYDEKEDVIDITVVGSTNRTIIKKIPPVKIRRIVGAQTITLFKLNLNEDTIPLFPIPTVNEKWFQLEISNCDIDHNYHRFFNNAKFTSCKFERFFIKNPFELCRYSLDNCEIEVMIKNFYITPPIIDTWRRFRGNNHIIRTEEG